MEFAISVPIGSWHELLPTCIASLAGQGAGVNVAIMDASGDPRVAALIDQHRDHFAYRRSGPDKGQSDAILEGWANVRGEILGWLNADDFLYPGAIAKARAVFQSDGGADVVTGDSAICDAVGRMTGYHWAVAPPGENLRSGCVISQPSCFFRRAAADRAGGLDASLHYTMDWDLWLRLLESGAGFRHLDEALSVVYWGAGTKTLGMNRARRRELLRLIGDYAPASQRFRAMRGFALRAMLDELRPAALARMLERRLRRRTPFVYGIGPHGLLAEDAVIYWTHWSGAAKSRLEISLASAGDVEIAACAPGASVARNNEGATVTFAEPVGAGAVTEVRLANSGSRARLLACSWG